MRHLYLTALALLLAACTPATAMPAPTAALAEATRTPAVSPTAPEPTPTTEPSLTAEPTLSPAERNYEWTDEEAVTVSADFTEEELAEKLRALPFYYPLVYSGNVGIYAKSCTLESISFLKESAYIRIGDFAITVTGRCTYLDVNREQRTITLALVVQNTVNKTQWMPPNRIMPVVTGPDLIQERFAQMTAATAQGEITAGSRLLFVFNRQNSINQNNRGAVEHHGALVDEL